jgi:hypothetical protein
MAKDQDNRERVKEVLEYMKARFDTSKKYKRKQVRILVEVSNPSLPARKVIRDWEWGNKHRRIQRRGPCLSFL